MLVPLISFELDRYYCISKNNNRFCKLLQISKIRIGDMDYSTEIKYFRLTKKEKLTVTNKIIIKKQNINVQISQKLVYNLLQKENLQLHLIKYKCIDMLFSNPNKATYVFR